MANLTAAGDTNVNELGEQIARSLSMGGEKSTVVVRAIGVSAVNQAIKGFIASSRQLGGRTA